MLHVQRLTIASSRSTATEQLGMQNTLQSHPHVSSEAGQEPDAWDGAMLSSWEYVPNMGLTSKIGTDSDVDLDELPNGGDDDRHPAKRQKTFHGSASRARSPDDSLTQVNSPGSNEGISALQNALNASFAHAAASTASTSPEKTASKTRVEAVTERSASPQGSASASQAPRVIEHPLFRTAGRSSRHFNRPALPFPGPLLGSSSNSSLLPSGASNSRRQPHRYAKAIYAEVDESPPPYAANQDEIEAWAEATVASIVHGKRPLPLKMDEIDARKMNGRKLVETLESLSAGAQQGSTTASTSSGLSGIQNAALPRVSMSSRSKAISEALFGSEDPSRPLATSKPTFKRKRWAADISRASSSSNVQTSAFPSSFSTPSLDYHPLSAIRPEAEDPPLSPTFSHLDLEQSPIAEPPDDSPAHSESIVADTVASDSLPGTPAVEEKEELSYPDAIPLQFTLRPAFQGLFSVFPNSGPSESNQPLAPRATSTPPSFVDGTNHAAASSSNMSRPLPIDSESTQVEDDPLLNSGQPEDIIEIISPEAQANVNISPVVAHGFVPPHSGDAVEIWNPPSDVQYGLPDRDFGSSPPETNSGHSDFQTVPGFQLPGLFTPTSQVGSLLINSPQPPIPETKPFIDESGSKLGTEFLAFEPSGPYMYELSEEASRFVSIPTVFEPGYLKNRFRDRWRNTEQVAELDTLLITQSVIAEAKVPVEDFYDEEEPPLSGWVSLGSVGSDEEEIDELANDSDQDTVITTASAARGRKRHTRKAQRSRQSGNPGHGPAEVAAQSLTSYFELRDFDVLEEGATEQDMLVDPPIDLVIPVARWTRELQCLVKGKQKLMEKDLLYLRDVLKDVHTHRAHIRSSSSLAKAALDVANMKQEDIPNLDKAGLRSLARQCILAWEAHRDGGANQGVSTEHSDAS